MFDAQCDFAAVVYGVKDNPDRLLLDFTEDLRRSGVRTAGLVQLDSWTSPSDDRPVRTVVLSTREIIPVAHERNLAATKCGLDCRKLASIAKMIEAAIQEGADLVVINRFGKLEATGKGLIELIQRAADADIPVLIAMPEHRFAGWIKYSAGMSVRLACRRTALDRWWQSVAMGPSGRSTATTLRALAK
jgi:nucleoside-triphosphatase THEP1